MDRGDPNPESVPSPESGPMQGPAPVPSIPGYELRCRIGRGSYGEVWLAREIASGTFQAMKIVYRATFEHDRPFERELSGIRKFEPVSRTHPSQLKILHVGRGEGCFYYVMELADPVSSVSGADTVPESLRTHALLTEYSPKTLRAVLRAHGRLPPVECLDIGLALTTALDHLHEHGLIHRDIKPSNVIFVNGVPKLADIGLVTDVGATISHVGTEGFLPPEGPGTPEADLYSLGKVLYEISTGRDRMDFPELPTFLDDGPNRESLLELNLVFLKACQNDPRKRYRSAREMAADLALLKSGRSLRRARTIRRRVARARLAGLGVAAATLVAAAAVFVTQQQRLKNARAEEKRLEREKQISEEARAAAIQRLASSHAANGDRLQEAGDLIGALPWFARALADMPSGSPGFVARRERLVGALSLCPRMPAFVAHSGPVHSAKWSSDGRRFITAGADGIAQVWDAQTGAPFVEPLRHDRPLLRAELNADSSRAVTLDRAGVARIWNLGNGTATRLPSDTLIRSVSISPNDRQILTQTGGADASLWEAGSARARLNLNHGTNILDAQFSPDGTHVATVGADRSVRIWQAEDGRAIGQTIQLDAPVRRMAFSADGRRLLTVSGARVAICNTRTGEPSVHRLQHDADVSLALFNPDGRQVAIAGADNSVRLWNPRTGTAFSLMSAGEVPATVLQFSPDGRWLAVAAGNSIRVLDARTPGTALPPIHHGGPVQSVEFSPAGHLLLSTSDDQSARLTSTSLAGWDSFAGTNDLRAEILMSWAALLAGQRISESGQIEPVPAEQLGQIWHSLKSTAAAGFSPFDLGAWHCAEATARERDRDWFGARFHWSGARALRPDDVACSRQLALAERALAADEARTARNPATIARIPDRPAGTRANLIDLGPFYNAALTETWFPTNLYAAANDLASLPRGVRRFGGVDFDVRGLIQLSGGALENLGARFPREAGEIPIGRTCRKLHFLHGAGWSTLFGTPIGAYVIRYADGEEREVKIIYGQNVRDWWFPATQPQLTPGAAVAWEGTSAASAPLGQKLRLYQMAWLNPRPDHEVRSFTFKSTMEKPAPFLIAVTVE